MYSKSQRGIAALVLSWPCGDKLTYRSESAIRLAQCNCGCVAPSPQAPVEQEQGGNRMTSHMKPPALRSAGAGPAETIQTVSIIVLIGA